MSQAAASKGVSAAGRERPPATTLRAAACGAAVALALLVSLALVAMGCGGDSAPGGGSGAATTAAERVAWPDGYGWQPSGPLGHLAHNASQALAVRLKDGRLRLRGAAPAAPWTVEIALERFGRGEALDPVAAAGPARQQPGGRVSFARGSRRRRSQSRRIEPS